MMRSMIYKPFESRCLTDELPNVSEILRPLLQRTPPEQQPLLIAFAERLAAERYRGWADGAADEARKSQLLACAAREDEIARRIESLYPEAAATERELLDKPPELEEINRSVFADRPLAQQFAIQAAGERLGAATWRAFAAAAQSDHARQAFLTCAELEEESAVALETLLAADCQIEG